MTILTLPPRASSVIAKNLLKLTVNNTVKSKKSSIKSCGTANHAVRKIASADRNSDSVLGNTGISSAETQIYKVIRSSKVPQPKGSEEEKEVKKSYQDARAKRYAYQRTLIRLFRHRETVNGKSFNFHNCKLTPIKKSENVDIIFSSESDSASYTNLQSCQKGNACPHCAEVKALKDKQMLEAMRACHLRAGGSIIMMTLTNGHHIDHSLEFLKDGQKIAVDKLNQWLSKTHFFDEFGGKIGAVRAWEKTYGKNGWHPHFHFLYYMNDDLIERDEKGNALEDQPTLRVIRNSIAEKWQQICKKSGLPCPDYEIGVDIRDGTHASKYVGKFGDDIITMKNSWGSSDEMSKSHLKIDDEVPESLAIAMQRDKGLTPWQLLELAHNGDKKAGDLFVEYAYATFGSAQLYWYQGTKDLYDLESEIKAREEEQRLLTATKFDDGVIPEKFVFLGVKPEWWQAVTHCDMRAQLLVAAETDIYNNDHDKKRITYSLINQCSEIFIKDLLAAKNDADARANIQNIMRDTEIDTQLRKSHEDIKKLKIRFQSDIEKQIKNRMGSKNLDYGLDLLNAVSQQLPKSVNSPIETIPDHFLDVPIMSEIPDNFNIDCDNTAYYF